MKIKGAIFDMDGTVLDSLMFWERTWPRLGEKYLNDNTFNPGKELMKTLQTMLIADAAGYINDVCHFNSTAEDIEKTIYYELERFYKTVAKPKPGAIEFLKHLKAKGVRLCLASATTKKYVMVALEAQGLLKYFDFVISCSDIGIGKDKPDIYLHALKLLGTAPEDSAVFEDSFVALQTAKSIGVHTVGIYDKYNSNKNLEAISEIYVSEAEDMTKLIVQF